MLMLNTNSVRVYRKNYTRYHHQYHRYHLYYHHHHYHHRCYHHHHHYYYYYYYYYHDHHHITNNIIMIRFYARIRLISNSTSDGNRCSPSSYSISAFDKPQDGESGRIIIIIIVVIIIIIVIVPITIIVLTSSLLLSSSGLGPIADTKAVRVNDVITAINGVNISSFGYIITPPSLLLL